LVRDLKVKRAVFLDRDGTINREVDYLNHPDRFELLPGAAEAIAAWNAAGWLVVVVTNQSGVGRGYFSSETLEAIHSRMHSVLAQRSARVDAIYCCPHDPADKCVCRKPSSHLFKNAARDLGIDLRRSFLVGDKWSDVLPAAELGANAILVRTGYGVTEMALRPPGAQFVQGAADLREAFEITVA
jgi:D-glycero-D-manno-heptose 1,7-bisphosphate phosphatase